MFKARWDSEKTGRHPSHVDPSMQYTITALPRGLLRSTLDYLHPLDLGTLLLCNQQLRHLVPLQIHRWSRIGTIGNKRTRKSTYFRRFVRLASTHRLCYSCFERKNGRSKRQPTCSQCNQEEALRQIHQRAWYRIERFFQTLHKDDTFWGHLARLPHNQRLTRNIGRASPDCIGLTRDHSFDWYVMELGRKILREQLVLLTAQEYRHLPTDDALHDLLLHPPVPMPSSWPHRVARRIIHQYYRSWNVFHSTLPNFHQDLFPTVRRLIPVQQHIRLQELVLHAITRRLRTRIASDIEECRNIERQLILQRLEAMNGRNYALVYPYTQIGGFLDPLVQRIVHYTQSIVGLNVVFLHYPNFRQVVLHCLLFSIFRLDEEYPYQQIQRAWPR